MAYLLVEDNPGDALLVRELIQSEAPLEQVACIEDAAKRIERHDIDLVILDLGLPDAHGVECVTKVLTVNAELPILVLTGRNDVALGVQCIEAGAYDYLPKQDLRPDTLRRAVALTLARSREAQARRVSAVLEGRMRAIVAASSDLIVSSDMQGLIETWNDGAERIVGISAREAVGLAMKDVLATPLEGAWEYSGTRRDGQRFVLSMFGSAIRASSGAVMGVATIGHDITERRRREAELALRDRQLSALAARLAEVRESERTRLSRKVHDEVGQLMTGIKLDLRWILRRLTADSPNLELVGERVRQTDELLDRALTTVRDIALELRPSALDALGLVSALRDEVRRFEARAQIAFEVETSTEQSPPDEVSTAFFRILQELLTNMARHSGASRGAVRFKGSESDWQLWVEDDGVGFSLGSTQRLAALGLVGVRERASKFDGTLELGKSSMGGSAVVVRIPRQRGE